MKELLDVCIKAMDSKLAENITVLDFRSTSPMVDYFVISTARNLRNALAIADEVADKAAEEGYESKPINYGSSDTKWILVDLGDVVCHIFADENERRLYDLEGLWKDLVVKR